MDTQRRKINELKTDSELKLDGKNRDHLRTQKLHDAFNTVVCIAIYVLPVLVLIWALVLAYHYISTGSWDAFDTLGRTAVVGILGYGARYLQENGFNPNKKD